MRVTDELVAAVKYCDGIGNDCTKCWNRNRCRVEQAYHEANKDFMKAMDIRRFLRPLIKRVRSV